LQAAGGGAKLVASELRRRWAATSSALGQIELERSVCLTDCVYEKRAKRRGILGKRLRRRHGGAGGHRGGAARELRRRSGEVLRLTWRAGSTSRDAVGFLTSRRISVAAPCRRGGGGGGKQWRRRRARVRASGARRLGG
jgi:hypothetical protein